MTQQSNGGGDDGKEGNGASGQTQEGGSSSSGDSSSQSSGDEGSSKTFTQEQLNAIVGRARTEERTKYTDYDKLKEDSEAYQTQRQAALTKEEKQAEDIAVKDREIETLKASGQQTSIDSAIRVSAAQLGFNNADDAVALIDRTGIAYTDTGSVTGVTEALTSLLESRAYLKGEATTSPPPRTQGGRTAVPSADLSQDEKDAAAVFGMTEERYAQQKTFVPGAGAVEIDRTPPKTT